MPLQVVIFHNRHFLLTYQTHSFLFTLKEKNFSPPLLKRAALILNTPFLTHLVAQEVLKYENYKPQRALH